MITFTKEQLIASAHARIDFAEMMLSGELEPLKERTWSIELELARIALASLEAEAVHQVLTGDAWVDLSKGAMESQKRVGAIVRTLYAAQPVLVAPDLKELEAILDWILMLPCPTPKATHFAKRLAVVIDTCRAAMLQGAEPVTTAYKLPGDFESFISWLTSGDGIPDWLIIGDKLDDEKVSFLLKVYCAGGNSPVIPDGWVACSERMPSTGEQVLAYRPDAPESNDPLIKMATYVGKSVHGHGFDCYCKPTHWMPLPAAPQQEVK